MSGTSQKLQVPSSKEETLSQGTPISIRSFQEKDLAEADRIFRLAFGTFVGLPDPNTFAQGREFVLTRWRINPAGAIAAECDGELVGSNFVTTWGSVGFFGPLTVRPDFWDRSVGKRLMESTVPLFEKFGTRHAGLFTFPHSPKHVGLYHKFGFFPRFLTALMAKPVTPLQSVSEPSRFSALTPGQQTEALRGCREITELIYEGLDLETEIRAVQYFQLGETVLVWDDSRLSAFAVCHFGKGTEGGPERCYVKFGAARPDIHAGDAFGRLLDGCHALSALHDLPNIEAGVSFACEDGYRRMRAHGFRTFAQGVTMHKPNEPGYHRPEVYAIDDWR
jgi:hypothetical protein